TYITELVLKNKQMRDHLENISGGSLYERTLSKAAATYPDAKFEALWREDVNQHVYLLQEENFSIEVLGPLVEKVKNQKVLRYFPAKNSNSNDVGRTKNGHSVVLKLQLGNIRILLG